MLKASPSVIDSRGETARLQRPIAKRKANHHLKSRERLSSASRPSRSRKAKVTMISHSCVPFGSRPNATRKADELTALTRSASSGSPPLKAKRAGVRLKSKAIAPASPPSSVGQTASITSPHERASARRKPVRARPANRNVSSIAPVPVSPLSPADVGHRARDTLRSSADAQPSVSGPVGLYVDATQYELANRVLPIAATGRAMVVSSPSPRVLDTIAAIKEQYRRRQDFLQEEGSLSRRIKKIVARLKGQMTATDGEVQEMSQTYLPLIPFLDSLKLLKTARLQEERKLKKHAEALPVWKYFGHPILGFGSLSLGAIIGEAGDLQIYSNPAKLWKRMGLALIGNERQRKCVDKEKAEQHGYSPRRRSVMFVIGDNLVKQKSAYRTVYDERKVRELEKAAEEGLTVAPAAKIPKGKHAEYRSEGHIHFRAKRYMEKRLLRDLWRAWRDHVSPATLGRGVNPCAPESTP
jgi:hypothetical protein